MLKSWDAMVRKGPRTDRPANSVDPKLLEILVCPLTKGRLEYDADKQELISRSAKLAYPIREGIPIMLPEEARRLEGVICHCEARCWVERERDPTGRARAIVGSRQSSTQPTPLAMTPNGRTS